MLLLVILLFSLFASLFTFSKIALGFSEPFFLIGSRMALAGVLLLVHQFIFNRSQFNFKKEHITTLFTLGLISIYITNIAEIWGMQYMTSAKACLIYSLSPFVAALVAYLVLKESMNIKKWLGLCIGFIGLLPILGIKSATSEFMHSLSLFSWPEIAMLIAVLGSVYGWILLKKLINEYDFSPIMANGMSMFIGGILALIHSYLSGESWSPIPVIGNNTIALMQCAIWMTLISNIICYNLYGYLLTKYSATFMSLAGLITPLFASLFGWYFLNEQITWHFYISIILFSIGLFIFYKEEISGHFA